MEKVIAALEAESLDVVSDLDVAAVIRDKLGEEIRDYRILGACAPDLARRVIDAQAAAGVLLPCNLVLRRIGDQTTAVDFLDPVSVLGLAQTPVIDEIAQEARAALERVRDRLAS